MAATKSYTRLRIFVASPGDVQRERDMVHEIADRFSQTGDLAEQHGLSLEVLDWRDLSPAMGRPEQVILEQLPVKNWDIFLGILWLRFGSATGARDKKTNRLLDSGTEEEFNLACAAREKTRRPEVAVFRCVRPPQDMKLFDSAQYQKVEAFFQEFSPQGKHPGLCSEYLEPEQFKDMAGQLLRRLILQHKKSGGKPAHRPKSAAPKSGSARKADALLRDYHDFVDEQHGKIKLFGFFSRANIEVSTMDVFVSLRFSDPMREMHDRRSDHHDRRVMPAMVLERV